LSGRGLCDELITRPEESYRLRCFVVCDLETSRMGAPYIYDISRLRVNEVHIVCLNNEQIFLSRYSCDAFVLLSNTPEKQRPQKHRGGNQKYKTEYSQSTCSKYLVNIYGVSSRSSSISYLTCSKPVKLSKCFLNKFD